MDDKASFKLAIQRNFQKNQSYKALKNSHLATHQGVLWTGPGLFWRKNNPSLYSQTQSDGHDSLDTGREPAQRHSKV